MEGILIFIGIIIFFIVFSFVKELIYNSNEYKKLKPKFDDLENKELKLYEDIKNFDLKMNESKKLLEIEKVKLKEKYIKIKDDLQNMFNEKSIGIPVLAKAYSEYFYLLDLKDSDYLKNKKNPAKIASDVVKKIGKEKEELLNKNKILEYNILYYEGLFPWLSDLKVKNDTGKIPVYKNNSGEIQKYIEPKEYREYWEYTQKEKIEEELKKWEIEWENIKNKEKIILENEKKEIEKEIKELKYKYEKIGESEKRKLNNEKNRLHFESQKLKKEIKELKYNLENLKTEIEIEYKKSKAEIEIITKQKSMGFPWLASVFADFFTLKDKKNIEFLENKNKPALKTAEIVSEIKNEKRELIKENKILEYKINYFQTLFPWLSDLIAENEDELIPVSIFTDDSDNNDDSIKKYLTQEQYKKLPSIERNQLALDRYIESRNKSKWAIGRDYEMYTGYLYSQKGYSIEYKGIIDGFDDLGRDIIATKGEEVCIIQCKYWAKYKEIHEKHIFQLFGTTIEYWVENYNNGKKIKSFQDFSNLLNNSKLKAIFFTSTKLSNRAKKMAQALNIEVIENKPIGDFPRIKCNIGIDEKNNKTKIYHLPMDQQYDRIKIGTNKEDCFCFKVSDAEKKGFRRAFKYHLKKDS